MQATDFIEKADTEISVLLKKEIKRQETCITLIPSENYASLAVLQALGSPLTNKYSEGYPGKRYYSGNKFIDSIETVAIDRAKKLFSVPHANVQPYSGSPANLAVYAAVCRPGDVVMGQSLPDGGHLTHGWKASFTGQNYKSVQYRVNGDGRIDLEELERLAKENKPKLIWVGATAYVREFLFEEIGEIADEAGAYLAADISHIAGLVASGVHKSPVKFAHIVTTTTHKTLRGPRGAIIMVTGKGLEKDLDLSKKIDKAVFPGLQGGPHDNTTAAIAVALAEAMRPEFRQYARQVVVNAKALADSLIKNNLNLVSGGTDNHMVLVDLAKFGKGAGFFAQEGLELAGITANKNTIPKDPGSPFYPSGLRLGTPAVTTRGMGEKEMQKLGEWVSSIVKEVSAYRLPEDEGEKKIQIKKFYQEAGKNKKIKEIAGEIAEICKKFPVYP